MPMMDSTEFLTGVIEGFYGRSWSMETRMAYIDYLDEAGLNTCIYWPQGRPLFTQAMVAALATGRVA